LIESPYKSLRVDPDAGSTLWISGSSARAYEMVKLRVNTYNTKKRPGSEATSGLGLGLGAVVAVVVACVGAAGFAGWSQRAAAPAVKFTGLTQNSQV
jgi:hypothetical protein